MGTRARCSPRRRLWYAAKTRRVSSVFSGHGFTVRYIGIRCKCHPVSDVRVHRIPIPIENARVHCWFPWTTERIFIASREVRGVPADTRAATDESAEVSNRSCLRGTWPLWRRWIDRSVAASRWKELRQLCNGLPDTPRICGCWVTEKLSTWWTNRLRIGLRVSPARPPLLHSMPKVVRVSKRGPHEDEGHCCCRERLSREWSSNDHPRCLPWLWQKPSQETQAGSGLERFANLLQNCSEYELIIIKITALCLQLQNQGSTSC